MFSKNGKTTKLGADSHSRMLCSRIEKTIKTIGDLTIRGRSNYVLQLTEFIINKSGRLLLLENAIVYRNSIEREAP